MDQNTAPNPWRKLISRYIKSEMTKKGIKYEELSSRLAKTGTQQTAANLRNKINRGILGADLFVQILFVLETNQLSREQLIEILEEIEKNPN
ncbi:DUF6471 domain-containing protein [Sessilibacter corallicola]|uniref:DUF6471 domain-containing protein n=1 Tax=Sessilibacter corallicola TaxID=2904075 RepID=A0ABQ0A3N7_9GAMM|nr:DUF6471 domain-containing protein [Sessilibacter corallicola]MCE2027121.1 DUF6471 domain-containing protein [Sessilibacter corallicola]